MSWYHRYQYAYKYRATTFPKCAIITIITARSRSSWATHCNYNTSTSVGHLTRLRYINIIKCRY